ncbi:MAG: imidazole glycerol phosphate synthase subunit HisH [Sphingobacteriales bacterium JAD_PAG50586_3]|nr:MAG: imidazole glycerol phosphate synthase subunit HisH [Sphingobacteriales bacterium JAD_PAG50586_3]
MKVVIINYGAGNTQSVRYAFERLGITPVLSDDAAEILSADKVIFPGVGHAKPAMEILEQKNLHTLIPMLKQPVLGICLGMQLMCKFSEEGNTPCLGIFDEQVKRFEPTLKVPHIGWNTVNNNWYYFVHSYYVPVNEFTTEQCNYITNFSAAMKKGNFYAVQYHPEKSGKGGEELLQKFIAL